MTEKMKFNLARVANRDKWDFGVLLLWNNLIIVIKEEI